MSMPGLPARDSTSVLGVVCGLYCMLNLRGVPYIDSTALGEIVRAYTTATRFGGALKLLNVHGRVHDLLVITRLASVFDSFDTEADAIRSFGVAPT